MGEFIPGTSIRVTRASDIVQHYLTTGSKVLDAFLYGGIPTFGVTEIVGEAGTGKTQLCLQLALNAQLPLSEKGLASEAIYISTEQRFPTKRLAELSEHFSAAHIKQLRGAPPTNAIRVEHISDAESLINSLQTRIPQLLEERKLKPRLIIVDSVAVLFRADYAMDDITKRTEDLRQVGKILHNLGRKLSAAIIAVNQVSGQVGPVEDDEEDQGDQGNVPALGLAWKNFVTTRILLSRDLDTTKSTTANGEEMDEEGESRLKRALSIKFAPHVPNRTIPIQLNQEGIKAAPNVPEYLLHQPSDSDSDS